MCLYNLYDFKIPHNKKYWYKVFRLIKKSGDLVDSTTEPQVAILSPLWGNSMGYPVNRWVDEFDYREETTRNHLSTFFNNIYYPCGFHCFYDKKDAFKWMQNDLSTFILFKVETKELTARGHEQFIGYEQNEVGYTRVRGGVFKQIKLIKPVPISQYPIYMQGDYRKYFIKLIKKQYRC